MNVAKDLGPLRNLPRSAMASFMFKAALVQKKPFHYALGAFTPSHVRQWLSAYWSHRIGPRHPFQIWRKHSGVFKMENQVKMSVAGDWGTGTDEANAVAGLMRSNRPDYTIHLGDVYYVGTPSEIRENFLGVSDPKNDFIPCCWPSGVKGDFALSGNHEMYARGYGYFDLLLPMMGAAENGVGFPQEASFFALENEYWRVLGLDTAYDSIGTPGLEMIFQPKCGLTPEQMDWLRDVVKLGDPNDKRGIVLFTHHQYYSAFENPYPRAAEQLAEMIKRPVLWFWGHEHRFAIYGRHSLSFGIEAYGRCIGHGGMPIERDAEVKDCSVPLKFVDNRRYPSEENIDVGYNGFVNLNFNDEKLTVDYVDVTGSVVASEAWNASETGGVVTA